MDEQRSAPEGAHPAPGESVRQLIARTAIVIPTYWSRSYGVRRPGDSIEDHPTPAHQRGTMARLLDSLRSLADQPQIILVLISSSAPDVATSAAYQVDTIRDACPNMPIALWTPTHVQTLHGRLRAMDREDWIPWFGARGYPQIRNLQLLVPHLIGCDLVIAVDDDEVIEDPYFLRRAASVAADGASDGRRVFGTASYYLDEHGNRMHDAPPESLDDPNPFERKIALMNGALEALEAQAGDVVESTFALGGNMTFHRDLFTRVGFDPAITRGEDIDYVINARLMGMPYHFDKRRPIRHLPPPGRSYRDFDYVKLQQDVRRFIYEREKLRYAQREGGFAPLTAADLMPYPGALLTEDLEEQAIATLERHRPTLFDTTIPEPAAFVASAVVAAREHAARFARFAREWPLALALLAEDRALRHVARGILP